MDASVTCRPCYCDYKALFGSRKEAEKACNGGVCRFFFLQIVFGYQNGVDEKINIRQ